MRAIKLKARVTPAHTLHLDLPADVGEGPAEVIVLLPEEPGRATHTLEECLAQLETSKRETRSVEAIDRALATEREDWD